MLITWCVTRNRLGIPTDRNTQRNENEVAKVEIHSKFYRFNRKGDGQKFLYLLLQTEIGQETQLVSRKKSRKEVVEWCKSSVGMRPYRNYQ